MGASGLRRRLVDFSDQPAADRVSKPERAGKRLLRERIQECEDLEGQIAFIANFMENRKDASPVHGALEWQDMIIPTSGIIRHMGGFQAFTHQTKQFTDVTLKTILLFGF